MIEDYLVRQKLIQEIEACIYEGFDSWNPIRQVITVQGMAEKIYATCLTSEYIEFYKWLTDILFPILMENDMTVETMYAKWYRSDPYNYGNNLRKKLHERGILE